MKVNIKDNSTSTENKYPCLMIDKNGTEIALFISDGDGFILNGENTGYHANDWHMDIFKPFIGTIELSND